jgi:hypothetical protein
MAATKWVVVNKTWCDRAGCATECNLAEIPCRWSFTRPAYDPFEVK